jgi:hypothetical protein
MRMLLLVVLAGVGCAAAQPKPLAKADLNRCEYVGQRIYDPHNSILDVTNTMGPSEVIYYRHEDHIYRVVGGKIYSCPIS